MYLVKQKTDAVGCRVVEGWVSLGVLEDPERFDHHRLLFDVDHADGSSFKPRGEAFDDGHNKFGLTCKSNQADVKMHKPYFSFLPDVFKLYVTFRWPKIIS